MVTVVDAAELLPLLLPELEPELQAAARRPAASRTPVVLKRLIVVALH
jgi:hypothetical protein